MHEELQVTLDRGEVSALFDLANYIQKEYGNEQTPFTESCGTASLKLYKCLHNR